MSENMQSAAAAENPLAEIDCPHLADGLCGIATAILGRPVPAFAINCRNCKAEATVENPTKSVVNLIRHETHVSGEPKAFDKIRERFPVQAAPIVIKQDSTEAAAIEVAGYVGLYPCVHRGAITRQAECQACVLKGKMVDVYACSHFGRECTGPGAGIKDAKDGEFVQVCSAKCGARKAPPISVAEWKKARCGYLANPDAWAGRYQGGTCFLICGGPSLANVDWSLMPARGPVLLAINNAAAVIPRRPDLWVASDDAARFAPEIWKDAGIAKFFAKSKGGEPLQVYKDGAWIKSGLTPEKMPNMNWRTTGMGAFDAATFLTTRQLQFGRRARGAGEGGKSVVVVRDRSTMLYAMRLAVDLGFSTINIVAADFECQAEGNQYGWDENAKAARATTNTNTFRFLRRAFKSLEPYLKAVGCTVWNCTDGGKLDAFPRRTFAEACAAAAVPSSETLVGLYDYSAKAAKSAGTAG